MTIYYHHVNDLDRLPDCAVIYDHNNQVWQKLANRWYVPGDERHYLADLVALPARLLDDGL